MKSKTLNASSRALHGAARFTAPICKFALSLCAALGIASVAQAENYWWTGSGTDTNYDTPTNWGSENGSTYPGSDDGAMFNGAAAEKTVTFNGAYTPSWIWVATDDVTKPVTWAATAGGSASTTFNIGLADQSGQVGALVVESGTYTAAGGFNVGSGQAAFEMTGGTITANGVSQWAYAANAALTADIKGGTLNFDGVDGNDGLRMMYGTGISNVITVSNATFAVNNGDLVIGVDADATSSTTINIDQDGVVSCGTPSLHRWLKMNSLGKVTINVNEGGTLAVWHIAHDAAGECKINLNGGKLKVLGGAGAGVIGVENDASLIVTVGEKGGTLEVPTGVSASVLKNLKGEGTLTVTGGGSATFAPQGNTCQIVANGATVLTNVDNHWNAGGGVDTDWNTSSNWDTGLGGALNAVFHTAYLNGAETTATFAGAYSYQAGLWIENGLDGIVTFSKAESAVDTAGLAVANNITIGTATSGALKIASGTYSVNGSLFVGYSTGSASLTMEDGTVSAVGDFDVGINAATSTFTMNGGTISAAGTGWWGADNAKTDVTINDGTLAFTSTGWLIFLNNTTAAAAYITNNVTGGTVSAPVTSFRGSAGTATINLTDDGTFETGNFAVEGTATYAINLSGGTLKAATDNVTFIPASDKLTVTVDGNATLNTNGKTITIDAAMLGDGTLTCVGGGTVTFTSLNSTCNIVADGATVNLPAVVTWTGNGDGKSWNDEGNWSNGAVPTGSDVVRFSSNADIVVEDSDGSVNDIIIDDGVELGLTINGKYLYLSGDISGAGKLVLGNTTGLYFNNGAQTVGVDIDVKEGSSIAFIAKKGSTSNVLSGNLTGSGAITARIDGTNPNGGGFTFNGDASGFSGTVLLDCNGNARPNMYINEASADNSGSSWTLNLGSNYSGGGSSYTSYFPLRSSNCIYKFGGLNGTIPWAKGVNGWLTGVTLQVGGLNGDCELDGDWGYVSASGLDWAAASATMTYGVKGNSFINVTKGGTLKITTAEVMRTSSSTITYSGANGTLKIASNVDFDPSTYLVASGSVAITFDDEGVSREWSGDLAGIYAFTKDGAGTLTLSSAPAYSGPTKVLAGKLVVPFGTAMSTLELGDNATVEVDMTDAAANATAFSVGKIVGDKTKVSLVNNTSGVEFTLVETANGFVYVNGSKSYTWVGPTGDSNWSTAANWGQETDIPTSADTVTIPGSMEVYIDTAAAALAITANGDLTIIGPSNAKTTLAATSLVVDGNLTVSNYVELVIGAMNVSGKITMIQNNIDSNSYADTLGDANVGNMDIKNGFSGSGVLLNDGSLELTGNDSFIGTIGGGQSVTKKGDDTYMLIGNNTFTGGLAIEKGTLKLGSPKDIADVRMDFDASDMDSFTVDEVTGYVTAWKDQINNLSFNYASGQHATLSTSFFGGKNAFSMTDTEETVADGARRVTNYRLSESNKDRRSKMMFIVHQASLADEAYRSIYTEDQQRNFRIHLRGSSSNHYWCWHNGGSKNQIITGFYLNDVYGNDRVTQNPQVLSVADSLIRNKTGGTALCYEVLGSYAETAECFKGGIGEIISYNRNLTHAERKAVDAYLMAKWGAGSATYNVIPANADVTMNAGATLDMGGLTQTVASFTGAGTVTNGYLKTTGDFTVAGDLTVQATEGQEYTLAQNGSQTLTMAGDAKGYVLKVPDGAKEVCRVVVPDGLTYGFEGKGTFNVTVVNAPARWVISAKDVSGGKRLRIGGPGFYLNIR